MDENNRAVSSVSYLNQDETCLKVAVIRWQYASAVDRLYEQSKSTSSAASCAAMVLLSLEDGDRWHANLEELCNHFDEGPFADALNVIRGQAALGIKPHPVIKNGETKFRELAERWECCQWAVLRECLR